MALFSRRRRLRLSGVSTHTALSADKSKTHGETSPRHNLIRDDVFSAANDRANLAAVLEVRGLGEKRSRRKNPMLPGCRWGPGNPDAGQATGAPSGVG